MGLNSRQVGRPPASTFCLGRPYRFRVLLSRLKAARVRLEHRGQIDRDVSGDQQDGSELTAGRTPTGLDIFPAGVRTGSGFAVAPEASQGHAEHCRDIHREVTGDQQDRPELTKHVGAYRPRHLPRGRSYRFRFAVTAEASQGQAGTPRPGRPRGQWRPAGWVRTHEAHRPGAGWAVLRGWCCGDGAAGMVLRARCAWPVRCGRCCAGGAVRMVLREPDGAWQPGPRPGGGW
jgi:hypothetical protein